ncbi:MAG: DNA polymerase IV [Candidatus Methanoperedens sp.]|nr:DNA polymerase IV [Candidatus Methanoperedens sp.]MCZ7369022.1 DNA polymerase IV [Candidatus Methanoperedens sp.]
MSDPESKKRIILHADMNYFFAQCEEREHPEIKGRPVVVCVYSGRGGDSGAVSTSNYEARKLGIKAGIPISRAKKMVKDAVFLPVNMELYRSISDEVMEILRGHCMTFEQESVDEAFCEITGMVPDYEEARLLAVKIKEEIRKKVGLTCSVGVAPNKLVAKIASDFRKPDGLTVVKPDEIQKFLAPLKITDIAGVGKKTGERLNELGVRTIGELSMVSAEELTREFGQAKGMWLKQASRGIDDSPVIEREGTEQIGRITTLKEDTKDVHIIFSAIDELSEDVYRKLIERKLGFKSISFVAITSDFKTHSKTHTLSAPAKDLDTIRTEARELARAFLTENPAALRRVGVKAANLMEEKGQRTLGEF